MWISLGVNGLEMSLMHNLSAQCFPRSRGKHGWVEMMAVAFEWISHKHNDHISAVSTALTVSACSEGRGQGDRKMLSVYA